MLNAISSGTGDTIPFECYDTETEKQRFATDLSLIARPSDKALLGRTWARSKIAAEKCARKQSKTGELVGTAFVARDMMNVAESLGEDGLLRYWGEFVNKSRANGLGTHG